jgi:uncharacterized membrane protein
MLAGRAFAVALVVSLMLNAFLAGSIATHYLRGHRDAAHHHQRNGDGGPGPRGERGMRQGPPEARLLRDVVHALGGPRDPRALTAVAEGRQRMASHRQRLEEAQAGVRRALSAEPYDEAQLTAALAQLREVAAAGQKGAQETLARLGRQLTPQERSVLRESLAEVRPPPDAPH